MIEQGYPELLQALIAVSAASVRLGARGISRRFGPVIANDEVDLAVAPGTIHAIVGENGAGKTTLMRMLYGLDRPDAGTVVLDDGPVRLAGPADASARGIGMVHQEFKLVGELSLLENLMLGREPTWRGRLDLAPRAHRRARRWRPTRASSSTGTRRPTSASVATRQRLEILRLLYRARRRADPRRAHRGAGAAAGRRADAAAARAARRRAHDRLHLAQARRGARARRRDHRAARRPRDRHAAGGRGDARRARRADGRRAGAAVPAPAGAASPASRCSTSGPAGARRRGRRRARLDLELRAGEVVGIAGVAGNGQDELVEALVGLPARRRARVRLAGADVTRADVTARRRHGLAYIPADRRRDGLSVTSSLADNAVAGAHRPARVPRSGWFRRGAAQRPGARDRRALPRARGRPRRAGRRRSPAATSSVSCSAASCTATRAW